jgi:2'-5' RNA ligase
MNIQKNNTRIQLTLFLNSTISETIEGIRAKYNPLQFGLINSHVTLCREDELENIDQVLENLKELKSKPITITFESAMRFSEGKGVLVPASINNKSFDELRAAVLKRIIENPRNHEPHITLMHPRNSNCTDPIFEEIKMVELPKKIVFDTISLIEQKKGEKWKVLKEYQLKH